MDEPWRSDYEEGPPQPTESFGYEEADRTDYNEDREPPIYKLISVFIGAFVATGDSSLLWVIQDRIASDFNSMTYAPLVLTSFSLGHCISLPIYGPLCDRYGSKIVLLYAYILFGIGCTLSGMAHSFPLFLLGRLITGVGAAGMLDLFMVLVCELYGASSVAKLRGYVLTTGVLGKSCGGPAGGLITDLVGWRWSLLGQMPVAFACMYCAWWLLPSSRNSSKALPEVHTTISLLRALNLPGIILFATFVGSAIVAIDLGGQSLPWDHPLVSWLIISGCLSGIAFFVNEWKRKEGQIIPLHLLMQPGLRIVYMGQLLFTCAVLGIMSSLAPYYTRVQHLPATDIALRILPQALGSASGAMVSSHIISKNPKHRKISIIAILISIAAHSLMVVQWADGIKGIELGDTFIMGFAAGLFFAGQFTALVQYAPADQRATATGLYFLCQQVGTIVGTTVVALSTKVVFRRRLYSSVQGLLPESKQENLIHRIIQDSEVVVGLSTRIQTVVKDCYQLAFSVGLMVPLFCVVMVLPSMIIQREARK